MELAHFFSRGGSHLNDKGLEQFEDDGSIMAKAFIRFSSVRIINHVRPVVDVDAACAKQEASQHRQNAGKSATLRETFSLQFERAYDHGVQVLQCRAVSEVPPLAFRETNDTSRTGDAPELLHELRPGRCGEKVDEAGIDQIKEAVGEIQRFLYIHHLETGIVQTLHPHLCICIGDHCPADIDPYYLNLGIRKGDLQGPTSRTAGKIEDAGDTGKIKSLGEEPTHPFRDEAILPEQARHFSHVFRVVKVNIIAV